jgi:hypothetical protein
MDLRASTGQYLLKPLFWETSTPTSREKFTPLYTLKEYDHEDGEGNIYKSAYQIYMKAQDETDAAKQLVGSLYHWDKLKNCKWFLEGYHLNGKKTTMGLEDWRKHKEALRESEALGKILAEAEDGNFQAQKYLHQQYVKQAPKQKRGPKEHPVKNLAEDELADNISQFMKRER